jgi:hypothetical protein
MILDENYFATVPHPPHSAELTPSDFGFFSHMTTCFVGRRFNSINGFLEAVIEFLNEIQASELQLAFTIGSNESNASEPTMETALVYPMSSVSLL